VTGGEESWKKVGCGVGGQGWRGCGVVGGGGSCRVKAAHAAIWGRNSIVI